MNTAVMLFEVLGGAIFMGDGFLGGFSMFARLYAGIKRKKLYLLFMFADVLTTLANLRARVGSSQFG